MAIGHGESGRDRLRQAGGWRRAGEGSRFAPEAPHPTAKDGPAQCGTARHGPAQSATARSGPAQCGTARGFRMIRAPIRVAAVTESAHLASESCKGPSESQPAPIRVTASSHPSHSMPPSESQQAPIRVTAYPRPSHRKRPSESCKRPFESQQVSVRVTLSQQTPIPVTGSAHDAAHPKFLITGSIHILIKAE